MQSVATSLSNLVTKLDPEEAKFFRIAQNNSNFEAAIQHAWQDNPEAADFILAHTNSLYFKKDDSPRKGPEHANKRYLMGVYLDEPMARAEVNARREALVLYLAQKGIHIDEIIIHPATRGMKHRHLFPAAIVRNAALFNPDEQHLAAIETDQNLYLATFSREEKASSPDHLQADQSRLLETVKRAFCQAFEDIEHTWSILEKIEGASLEECTLSTQATRKNSWYKCHFYTSERDKLQPVIAPYEKTILSRARRLGLNIREIKLHESPHALRGSHAFLRSGYPVALIDTTLQESPPAHRLK